MFAILYLSLSMSNFVKPFSAERKRKDQEEISEELGDFSKKLQTLRKGNFKLSIHYRHATATIPQQPLFCSFI